MDKEEAMKILKDFHDKSALFSVRTALETLHPELKESEDERIRKELIEHVKDQQSSFISAPDCRDKYEEEENNKYNSWLSWLEKQGEQKLPIEKLPEEMKTIGESLGFTTQEECDEYNKMVSDIIMSADKVEPKFKVGDWIIDDKNRVGIIVRILDEHYIISFDGREVQISFEWEGKLFRKWAIQDAKDGDVLCYKDEISLYKHDIKNCTKQETTFGGFVYHCCYDGKRFITDSLYSLTEQDKMDIHPATKEQRDLLFQKMKEAGYTFDFEKKELKKISQRMISAEAKEAMYGQPAWSEEDKTKIKSIIALLKSPALCAMDGNKCIIDENIKYLKSFRDKVQPKQEWSEEDMKEALRTEYEKGRADAFAQMQKEWSEEDEKCIRLSTDIIDSALRAGFCVQLDRDRCIDWFNSLKERYIWKPSYKQIDVLKIAADGCADQTVSQILSTLYKDLEKLKGE